MLSPFGGEAKRVQRLAVDHVVELYRKKCGVDVTASFKGHRTIELYQCSRTGYRFWTPAQIAGDEALYASLSEAWPYYYRQERWEYPAARKAVRNCKRLLEVGCGRGYFLRSLESQMDGASGIDFNTRAIATKVTRFPIETISLEVLGEREPGALDAICAFQVLEHVVKPRAFLEAALRCLVPGGLLVLSTPNHRHQPLRDQTDAFDLPPHHMGHFEESTFDRVAELLDLDVVTLLSEPRSHEPEAATETTRRSLAYRTARRLAARAYELAYRSCAEPGRNLFAVLRKR